MSSNQLIVNELLAFIQNAIDTLDEVSIRQICKSSFSEDDICSGKALLFQALGKVDQMPPRRRDGSVKSLQDIITVFKETDPDNVPAFVARRLDKLPPVTFDHVDVTRLLKDITSLKMSLAEMQSKLEVSNNTISELRAEVESLRDAVVVSRSREATNFDSCSNARAPECSVESARCDVSQVADVEHVVSPPAPRASLPVAQSSALAVKVTSCAGASTPCRAYAAVTGTAAAKRQAAPLPPQKSTGRKQPDKDGFILVEKKKKSARRNLCGTAAVGSLRPAVPTTQLYVSRLHYSTKAEQLVEYLRAKTNFVLRVDRLESRRNVNFNSFVVRVPTDKLSTFMKEEFWPKGVVFRRFRGQLFDTQSKRLASSSQRDTTTI